MLLPDVPENKTEHIGVKANDFYLPLLVKYKRIINSIFPFLDGVQK